MNSYLSIISLVVLICISAVTSGSETALFSLSSLKLRQFRTERSKKKLMIVDLLSRPRDLLVTVLMTNIAVNIMIQNSVSDIFGALSSWLLTVGLPLVLVLVFGEVIPKSVAMANNEKIALLVVRPIYFLRTILTPFRFFFTKVAGLLSHSVFFFLQAEKEISIEELKHALRTSRDYGIVSADEAMLIRGSLNLSEMSVKELMRPRIEIKSFDCQQPLEDLVSIFIDKECSKVPVIEGDLEKVVGLITSDLFFLHQNKIHTSNDVKRFVKEMLFIPESMKAKDLFVFFHEKEGSLALVIDEYGLIAGLITMEDITEIVVGQIEDKLDEESSHTRPSADVIIANGKMELAELEDIFDISFKQQSTMTTVGGFLTECLGDIPRPGAKYVIHNVLFNVLESSATRVTRVYIRKLKPKEKV